jgi:hypothetical protein
VVKEPGKSAGAPLLVEAFAESRMVLLVRATRDVVASWMDAQNKEGWKGRKRKERTLPSRSSFEFVKGRARKYLKNVGAKKPTILPEDARFWYVTKS